MTHVDVLLYARQSKGYASIDQQLELGDARAADRGWRVVGRFKDKSVSATSGEPRPGYDEMLEVIKAGRAKGIVVRHYDRLYRQPRELEGLIDDTEGVHIESVYGGGYDLGTADGRMQARVVGAFARGEAEKKAERQRLGAQRDAVAGKARLGTPRPFGWLDDRVTAHPQEGPAVADACRALLAGGTISGVCRDWTARGLVPHQSAKRKNGTGKWSRTSVGEILRNPRVAGISVYKGEEVGKGQWEALVTEETYRAVVRLLTDPARKHAKGVRTVLGGLARCHCGNHVTGSLNQLGQHIYRCNPATREGRLGPHVTVRCAPVDEAIGKLVVRRLQQPDAVDLLPEKSTVNVTALRDEATGIRARMDALVDDCVLGKVTERQRDHGLEVGSARLTAIEAELAEAGRESVIAPLLAAQNIAVAWEGLATDRRRAIVDALMTPVLRPAGRGARVIDPNKVIDVDRLWKDQR